MSGVRCLTVAADLFVPLPTQTALAWWFTPVVAVVASLATSTGRLEAGGRR